MKPHKHAELIKAWADGVEIQQRYKDEPHGWTDWVLEESPQWWTYDSVEYRIKPEPKPDEEDYLVVEIGTGRWITFRKEQFCDDKPIRPQIRLIYDGETGELKSAEVIK